MSKRKCYDIDFKLQVAQRPNSESNHTIAKELHIDERQVRDWRRQKEELIALIKSRKRSNGKRRRFSGGGRKVEYVDEEAQIAEWVLAQREKALRVTFKYIAEKAKEIIEDPCFKVSRCNMDEMAIWYDMPGAATIAVKGTNSVPLLTTGHEKQHITVCLAAMANGCRLKPSIVFKGKRFPNELKGAKNSYMGFLSPVEDAVLESNSVSVIVPGGSCNLPTYRGMHPLRAPIGYTTIVGWHGMTVMSDRADLYKVGTVVLCRWEENRKVLWFPARILKHPVPGQSEGSWKVQWLREASGTGTGPTGSTERFDPWINDDGENLCSTVVNKEDFKVLPGVGTNHPTEPSQPSASSNLTDAESAEQQTSFKSWKGQDDAKVTYCTIEQNTGKTNVTNPFDMAKEIALKNAQKTAPYPKTHQKYLDTLDKVAMWIAVRCMPIQAACSEQFDAILKELDPKFPRMSHKEIRGTILQKHLQAIDQLKSICPPRVATTIDFWSRLDRKGFGTCSDVTVGIDDEDHNGEISRENSDNIAQFYCGLLEKFNLTPHANTTDAPTVMEAFRAMMERGSGVEGLRCVSHVLHNAIRKACETRGIKSEIDKLRSLCKEIKSSSLLSGQLSNLAKMNGKNATKVVLDCKWRWGYCLKMIRRYMFLKDEINELQCDNDVNLTTQARLTELGDMLQEAVDLIFFMEGSKYVTLACIPFALHYLYIHLEDKAGEDFGVAQARRVLREYINRRYPLLPIHFLAAYLDPRSKK
ncbi:hypothetical protein EMCRGX_G027819 [Ephydatia muelleri]